MRRRAGRILLTIVVLLGGAAARAGNPLARAGRSGPLTPDAAAAQAAAAAAQSAAAAAVLARQAESPLRKAMDQIRAFQASQAAARAAAQGAANDVPNGIGPGGLELAPNTPPQGATLEPQTMQGNRTEVTVQQDAPRAILTWTTFNVGSLTDLKFDQSAGGDSASSWVAINRVIDPLARPSQILGTISAPGQVYVINLNGVIFGGTAQVNTGSLVISGLDFTGPTLDQRNQRFLDGTLFDLSFSGAAGPVTVQPGATLSASAGGRVLLLGSEVVNGGTLLAPDGQVYLAAGSNITLAPSGDLSSVRGLASPTSNNPVQTGDGRVENDGVISAPRGNVSMVAGQTVQNGMVTATTSADANGSISLGGAGFSTTLGPDSVTQVLPDDNGKKVVGTVDFKTSRIDVQGDKITVLGGATLYAPSGAISLSAVMTTEDPLHPGTDDTRVYIESGARIDVSGLQDVAVPMEQNSIQAELRANELRDDPLLRNNPNIRGKTVYFDGRLGVNPLVADVSGYYDLIQRDVTQMMTAGGTVTLRANEIITRQGSVIDLSGGSLRYADGYVRSSVLIDAQGNRVPIEQAVPGVAYVGLDGDFVATHPRWGITETFSSAFKGVTPHFEAGYQQGANAGTLILGTNEPTWYQPNTTEPRAPDPAATGVARILDGDVVATTIVGPNQRQIPTGSTDPTQIWRQQPARATLQFTNAGDVSVASIGPQLPASFQPQSPVDPSLRYENVLPARWFDGKTFGTVSIVAGYDPDEALAIQPQIPGTINRAPGGHLTIAVGTTVDLGNGGSFTFIGKGAEIDGTIVAPGGAISLQALQKGGDPDTSTLIHLGSGGVLDVAGRWSNDFLDGSGGPLRAIVGGSVSLTAPRIVLDTGSLIDVSGGARLDATGTKLALGNAGSITLDVSRFPIPDNFTSDPQQGTLLLGGTLSGYSGATGGSLTLNTGFDVWIGPALPSGSGPTYRLFLPEFFTHGGFASYSILGERSVTVASSVELAPSVETLQAPAGGASIASGARFDDIATRLGPDDPRLSADLQREPMTLKLSTLPVRPLSNPGSAVTPPSTPLSGDVWVQSGATIRMNPGSTVKLGASDSVTVDGTISAPAGDIELTVTDIFQNPQHPATGIVIGDEGQLLAPGYQKVVITTGNVPQRTVESGGTISLTSRTEVEIAPGAVLDVSGIQGITDLPSGGAQSLGSGRFQATPVDGNAGAITVVAVGGDVGGNLRLGAGGPDGIGGALTVARNQAVSTGELVVHDGPDPSLRPPNVLEVDARSVNHSGAADVTLQSLAVTTPTNLLSNDNPILFDGDVGLEATRSITLVSPFIGTTNPATTSAVVLTARQVTFEGQPLQTLPTPGSTGQTSSLTVQAEVIDIQNTVVLGCITAGVCSAGGFGQAELQAFGDVRLIQGLPNASAGATGGRAGLLTTGTLQFDAAQVYVFSLEQDGLSLQRAPDDPGFLIQASAITIRGNGNPAPVPLAFGGRLTLEAPIIDQGGTLRAPEGEIFLNAGPDGTVTLRPGSLTSASLEGQTAPFGMLQTGGVFFGYDQPGQGPTKAVNISGAKVDVQQGAVIDVSGGSDLLGVLFSPGNSGSQDILTSSGGFAILPGLRGLAPVGGVSAFRDSRIAVGEQVWLHGVPGLPDGYYTLLPAHYALLPGGMLIEPMGGSFAAVQPAATQADGSVIVSGFLTGSGQTGYGRFVVMPQSVFLKYSELDTFSFDQYATTLATGAGLVARTPNDAGGVVLSATESLSLQGVGRFGAGAGGLLGNLDVSAPKIAVVGGGNTAPDSSYLTLDPQALEAFGAASVLLGGVRSETTGGTALAVNASEVYVSTGAAGWTAPEILLAATDQVRVADGSILRAEGATIVDGNPLLVGAGAASSDAAVLRVTTGARVPLIQQNAVGQSGTLSIGAASISASGSLSILGSKVVNLSSDATFSATQFDLGSVRLNLGDASGAPGTTLDQAALARLGAAANDILLRGADSVHVYGDVSLGQRGSDGTPTLERLTLDTGLLQGEGSAGVTARVTAGTLTLENSGAASSGGVTGGGALALDVDSLQLGPGDTRIAGYATLQGRAGTLVTQGPGSLTFDGNLTLSTALVRPGSPGSAYALTVGGAVVLSNATGAPASVDAPGGQLSITGSSLSVDTALSFPAGELVLVASTGSLTLGSSARLDVSGVAQSLQDQVRLAPGGTLRLSAGSDLDIASGAVLNVGGASAGGDAGSLVLSSGGTATLQGTLSGSASAGYQGGAFSLDASGLSASSSFSGVNALLQAGGFDRSLEFRLRTQDITVATGETVRGHEVILQSDSGSVVVAGRIDASGSTSSPGGGDIVLVGGSGVQLLTTAELDAQAGATPSGGDVPRSGEVQLVATGGTVDVLRGAVVDVSGGRSGGGEVIVRADRDATRGVAVTLLDGDFRGTRSLVVQGLESYTPADGQTVDAPLISTMLSDATSWLQANAGAIESRLRASNPGLPGLTIAPAMQVNADGDLRIVNPFSLAALQSPGDLAFVSRQGSISILASVSDGFANVDPSASLLSSPSFTLRFESAGDIVLASGVLVRTGTGDIVINAGRDLVLSDRTSVIYTAGAKTAAVGYTPPTGAVVGEFPTNGGDLDLRAGRDIIAPVVSQSTSAWLFRSGDTDWTGQVTDSTVATQTSWSIFFGNFQQGVGALGGGDVRVAAGRNVQELQISLPTTGFLTTAPGSTPTAGDLMVRGGGDLDLSAGGDLLGGLVMLGRGHADLRAAGDVAPGPTPVSLRLTPLSDALGLPRPMGLLVGLMDATASVTAGGSVNIEGVFDPMREGQLPANLGPSNAGTTFSGYTDQTAFGAVALGGSLTYQNDPWAAVDVSLAGSFPVHMRGAGNASLNSLFGLAPPTLKLASLHSDVVVDDPFGNTSTLTLASAPRGTLELLAGQDVHLGVAGITEQDVSPLYVRGPLDPSSTAGDVVDVGFSGPSNNFLRGLTPVHAGDPDPVRIYAVAGSVCAKSSGLCVNDQRPPVQLTFPKPLEVIAGVDIFSGTYTLQNNGPNDLSLFQAGRDLFQPVVEAVGSGTVLVQAGRDVVLNQIGVDSTGKASKLEGGALLALGNRTNPTRVQVNQALPDTGANFVVLAGTANGVDWNGFAAAYLDPGNSHNVVRTYLPELRQYMAGLGVQGLSDADLVAAFQALSLPRREVFLDQVYLTELQQTGIDYNDPESPRYQSYNRGFTAVSTLFPTDPTKLDAFQRGDVIINAKPVETQAQGNIQILAPYGSVEVGTNTLPAGVDPASGGIVTRRGGNVQIMADGNIDLFTSRVFTLQGGDILMWSTNGSITAGFGSKTSVFQKPLAYLIDPTGYVSVDAFGLQTGAGIGVLDALQNAGSRKRSRLDLIAPRGEVNAGDAGIRVVGDINIAAAVVVGVENIQFTGKSAGVPKVEVPNLAALTSVSQLATAATQQGVGPDSRPKANINDLPSIITVEVLGYETPARPDAAEEKKKRK